jgi:hypothetical protein
MGDAWQWGIGDEADPSRPVIMYIRMTPEHYSPAHTHRTWAAVVIVEGSIKIGDRWLKAGDVMLAPPNVRYGPFEPGPSGVGLLEIPATPDGIEPVYSEEDLQNPHVIRLMEWVASRGGFAGVNEGR